MRAQMAPQASMQMRRGMPRGMAPTRNISASPQATVHRPGEGLYSAAPQSRRPPENSMQRRAAPPAYGKYDLKKPASYANCRNPMPLRNKDPLYKRDFGFTRVTGF